MNRSKLRNKFLNTRNEESKGVLIAKEISVLACYSKLKKRFGKLDHRVVSHSRRFWRNVSPLFSEKAFHKESIILNNNNKTINNK